MGIFVTLKIDGQKFSNFSTFHISKILSKKYHEMSMYVGPGPVFRCVT